MDDLQQNTFRIKEWRHLQLKYALGWLIKFQTHFIFYSHKNKWKRLQWNDNKKMHWKIILMKNMDVWTHLYLG